MRTRHVFGLLGLSLLLAAPATAQDPTPKRKQGDGPVVRRERPADQDGPKTDADRPDRRRGDAPGDRLEGPRLRRAILARYDANKNGKLDPAELQRLAREVNAGGGKPGDTPPPPGARGDRGGPAVSKELLQKYDANKDGKLDEAERAKMRADRQRQRGDGTPPVRRGGRGGGEKPPTRRGGGGGGAL